MFKKIVIFSVIIHLLYFIPLLGEEPFFINDCVLSNSCNLDTSKLKKHLLHATGMFEVLDDPYSSLDEIKLEFYVLQRKNKEPIHIGVINMWADQSIFVLHSTQGNTHNLEIVQIINLGRINNFIIKDIDNDGNEDIKLINFSRGEEPQSLVYLYKNGVFQRP